MVATNLMVNHIGQSDIGVEARAMFVELAFLSSLAYEHPNTFESALILQGLPKDSLTFIDLDDTQVYFVRLKNYNVVAFRGTQVTAKWSWTDVKRNIMLDSVQFPYGKGKVHTGYLEGVEAVKDTINQLLAEEGDKGVIFTGHSLGGASATLARAMTDKKPFLTVTFGAPKAGNKVFNDSTLNIRLVRIVNSCDIAPRYPSDWATEYRQTREYFQLTRSGKVKLKRWGWLQELTLPALSNLAIGILDHRVGEYVTKLRGADL